MKHDPETHKFVCECTQRDKDIEGNEAVIADKVICTCGHIAPMHGQSFATHTKEVRKNWVTAGEDKQFVEIPPKIGKKALCRKKVMCRVRWESKQTWEATKK